MILLFVVIALSISSYNKLESDRNYLLKYVIDNNLTNKGIEKRFKTDIINYKINNYRKELNGK